MVAMAGALEPLVSPSRGKWDPTREAPPSRNRYSSGFNTNNGFQCRVIIPAPITLLSEGILKLLKSNIPKRKTNKKTITTNDVPQSSCGEERQECRHWTSNGEWLRIETRSNADFLNLGSKDTGAS